MQYILVHNDRVLNGPRDWRRRSFEDTLREECAVEMNLPVEYTGGTITINSNTKIMPCEFIWPNYNPRIQYPHGPFWDTSGDIALGTFEVRENSIDSIKNALKAEIAATRYAKENSGFTHTVQNTQVFVDTNRDIRNIFVQKLMLMNDAETCTWKFPQGWRTLTKSELAGIVTAGAAFVQGCFDWERDKGLEIDNCTTTAELAALVLEAQ